MTLYWCIDKDCKFYRKKKHATATQIKFHYKTKLYSTIIRMAREQGVERPEIEKLDRLQRFLVEKSEVLN